MHLLRCADAGLDYTQMRLAQCPRSVPDCQLNNERNRPPSPSSTALITCCRMFCCICAALLWSSGVAVLGTLLAESPPSIAKFPAASSSMARMVGAFGLLSCMNCGSQNAHHNSIFSWQLMPPAGQLWLIWCANRKTFAGEANHSLLALRKAISSTYLVCTLSILPCLWVRSSAEKVAKHAQTPMMHCKRQQSASLRLHLRCGLLSPLAFAPV